MTCVPILAASAADKEAQQRIGREKAETLRELASISEDNIIVLNKTGYENYVVDYPRPYDMVLLFNADHTKYKCNPCQEIAEHYKQVVYSYKESGADYPSVSASGTRHRAVFFATMDYAGENQALFK
jgi:hypothetical protein